MGEPLFGDQELFWTFKFRCMLDIHVAILRHIWSSGNDQTEEINLSHLHTDGMQSHGTRYHSGKPVEREKEKGHV